MNNKSRILMLAYLTSVGITLVLFFATFLKQNPIVPPDIAGLLLLTLISASFWYFDIRVTLFGADYGFELGGWFILFVLMIKGPSIAIATLFLGTFLYTLTRKLSLRPKI